MTLSTPIARGSWWLSAAAGMQGREAAEINKGRSMTTDEGLESKGLGRWSQSPGLGVFRLQGFELFKVQGLCPFRV